MRTHLVFAAKEYFPNRFELVHQASQFARRLHLTKERMGDTINQALERMSAPGESEGEN